jgi:prepilin-type N-terminal cleavage/methylation domain-containing protein
MSSKFKLLESRSAHLARWVLRRNTEHETRDTAHAFTLIEIMIVVAIIAILMTISIPSIRTALEGGRGINGAVKMVQEACSDARAMAILDQRPVDLVIRPHDGTVDVSPAGATASAESLDVAGNEWRMQESGGGRKGGGTEMKQKYPAKFPDGVQVEGLGLNGLDWTEDEVAHVRFYLNGTSDEMTLVLYRPETNERRNVWLEVVTGLAEIEVDPKKFKAR